VLGPVPGPDALGPDAQLQAMTDASKQVIAVVRIIEISCRLAIGHRSGPETAIRR
jgi:hypothetical protein